MARVSLCDVCAGVTLPIGSATPAPRYCPDDVKEICWQCEDGITGPVEKLRAKQEEELSRLITDLISSRKDTMAGQRIPLRTAISKPA